MKKISFLSVFMLSACVTINIYFPAAAAEQVADEIIKSIQSEEPNPQQQDSLSPQSKADEQSLFIYHWIDNALNILITPAQAAQADLSVNTSEIRQLRATMRKRFTALKTFYTEGLMGIKSDGFIISRGSIPLKNRNKIKKLIAAENADRQRLYQAIANANGHPDWFADIKAVFAKRWISNAQSGWWVQTSNGNWKQK